MKVVDDCKKIKAKNEKITSKYNKAKVHIIEFDSIVTDFIVLQAKGTAAMAEKEGEIGNASKEITAVKAELEKTKAQCQVSLSKEITKRKFCPFFSL